MTTTPPVTDICSSTLSLLTTVTMSTSLMGLPVISGQHDVLLSPLTLRDSGGVVGLATVPQQQPQSQMPLQAYANYAMGPLHVGFTFRVEAPTIFYVFVSILVYAFYFKVPSWIPLSPMGAQPLGFVPLQPFGAYPWQVCVQLGDGHWATEGMHFSGWSLHCFG